MFFRALLAFLLLPGTVAFVVPAWMILRGDATAVHPVGGGILLLTGCVALLWCVRDFYVAGRGTLAPWAPPRHLVVIGLYRYSRNPMYVAVSLVLLGWAVTYRSAVLLTYAGCVLVAFHLRIVLAEEPWLARTFGDEWLTYKQRVPRWFGRGAPT